MPGRPASSRRPCPFVRELGGSPGRTDDLRQYHGRPKAPGIGGNIILDDESALPSLSRMTDAGKKYGHHFWAQISHSGRQTSVLVNRHPLAPSDVQLKKMGLFGKPRQMTEAQIETLIRQFVHTAVLCKKGGFTGIQLHSAHGYLLSEFLSPRTNTRTDRWGGSIENRARLLMRIVKETREAVGAEFPSASNSIPPIFSTADFPRKIPSR
ncbi:MAG: hypothetical protein IPJ40_07630 [Saprospirales bacterium]|nr:hypothetical protein [Saprospirales bacterium]